MDKFREDMTTEEMVEYIRRTPKQYVSELPDKLEKWHSFKKLKVLDIDFAPGNSLSTIAVPEDKVRREIATKILIRHAPAATINPESLADYCVEAADELLKRLKR